MAVLFETRKLRVIEPKERKTVPNHEQTVVNHIFPGFPLIYRLNFFFFFLFMDDWFFMNVVCLSNDRDVLFEVVLPWNAFHSLDRRVFVKFSHRVNFVALCVVILKLILHFNIIRLIWFWSVELLWVNSSHGMSRDLFLAVWAFWGLLSKTRL